MLRAQSKCRVGNNLKPVLKKFWGDARKFVIIDLKKDIC